MADHWQSHSGLVLQRSEPWMRLMDNREIIAAILTAGMLQTLPIPGRIRPASAGTTSRPANRSRTASSKASTAACATSS